MIQLRVRHVGRFQVQHERLQFPVVERVARVSIAIGGCVDVALRRPTQIPASPVRAGAGRGEAALKGVCIGKGECFAHVQNPRIMLIRSVSHSA